MKYFGYYADERKNKNVNCTLSAVNKMHYIATRMVSIAGSVEIVSAVTPYQGNQEDEVYEIESSLSVRYFKASSAKNRVLNVIKRTLRNVRFFNWAYRNIKQNEVILVYHSLGYMKIFRLLKKLKKFSMILEVEEVYSDVLENQQLRDAELQFMNLADAYIFPTELLSRAVNKTNKPEVIIYGAYSIESVVDEPEVFDTESNHILYAGTFDPRKGGVYAAINAIKNLPENYHLHVLGFGTDEDVQRIEKLTNEMNQRSKAKVSYDGLKSGEDYVRFLQSCDVGLSTQNPNASFNDTSFPSKILSYFANGLKVVSVRIPVVETSKIGDLVFYYDEQEPRAIADAIIKACETEIIEDVRDRINKLDADFTADLKTLVDRIERKRGV